MNKKNDQVFPVSLSEIAFILVFLLMLLLGFMIVLQQKEKIELTKKLENSKKVESAEAAAVLLEKAQAQFEASLAAANHPAPKDVTMKLVEAANVQVDMYSLRAENQGLMSRLNALEPLMERIEKAGAGLSEKIAREAVEEALDFQNQITKLVAQQDLQKSEQGGGEKGKEKSKSISDPKTSLTVKDIGGRIKDALVATNTLREETKSQLGVDIRPGDEAKTVKEVVAGAKLAATAAADRNGPTAMKSEIDKLRGQIQYFTNRDKFRGLDHPPCWADENGKIDYLFSVETRSDGFVTTKGWPQSREQDARALPSIAQALSDGSVNAAAFSASMKPILDWSKNQNPQCRHFVYLTTTIGNADARDSARKLVEAFFYKYEASR